VWRDEKFPREIVGVVGDVKAATLDEEVPSQIYVPHAQDGGWSTLGLAVKTKGDPKALISQVRDVIRSLDKDQPVFDMKTMDEAFSESVARTRLIVLLFGVFSVFALALATVGIYGVMAYSVAQRTHEIGIRLALGAQRSDVLRMIINQGMILALIGAVLGLAGAFAVTRVMRNLLYGVSTTDPVIFVSVPLLLTLVALAACYIGARRATKVDPMIETQFGAAHHSRTAIALVNLCQACRNARLCSPSRTSSVTSPPRTAGKSCKNTVPDGLETSAIIFLLTWNGSNIFRQLGSDFGTPMVSHRVAYTAFTFRGSLSMSWCSSTNAPYRRAKLWAILSTSFGKP
jgi:hypothetical protein